MSKTFKRLISLVLTLTLTMSFLLVGMTVFGEDMVAINAVNFPDDNFRIIISEQFDIDGDGYLDANERSGYDADGSGVIDADELDGIFDLSGIIDDWYEGITIASIKGVELFDTMDTLYCSGIGLQSLDADTLPNIKYMYCGGNEFTELDISSNTGLVALYCGGGELESISFPISSNLRIVHCYSNKLTNINVSSLFGLTELYCHSNELTQLDLPYNGNLRYLNCSNNHITSLDLSNTAIDTANTPSNKVVNIGNQNVEVIASQDGDRVVVPFSSYGLTSDNYVSSSLDELGEGYGFDGTQFYAADLDSIRNGIEYYAGTNKESAPDLQVNVKTSHQIDFYYDEEMTDYIGFAMVFPNETVVAPELKWTPKCKALDTWSESLDNVQGDMSVYAIWKDAHTYVIDCLDIDYDTVNIDCDVCHNSKYTVSFNSLINAKSDEERFDAVIDINNDGYINAKDYAILVEQYKVQ